MRLDSEGRPRLGISEMEAQARYRSALRPPKTERVIGAVRELSLIRKIALGLAGFTSDYKAISSARDACGIRALDPREEGALCEK